ncbi:hypothetical protein JXM67_04035 [candidate division WOR-3 bacterium]|nr:hypothetical protein [candidate division WOR-3 bacterium]
MKIMCGIIFLLTTLPALEYRLPEEVVVFEPGSGQPELGLKDEDVPLGPYRLIAADPWLYLLDQLNHRVLCFDTSGRFVKEIIASFRPSDMAVDGSGRIWLLENRTQPAEIIIMDDDEEVDSLKIGYEPLSVITEISLDYNDELVLFSGGTPCRASAQFTLKPTDTLALKHRLKVTCMPTAAYRTWFVEAIDKVGQVTEFYLRPSMRDDFTILADDASGKLYLGIESVIQDKSGSFYKRSLKVYEDGEQAVVIPVDENYFSYDVGWRNVSVDAVGNVYVFTSSPEGRASILKWRVSP